MSTALDVAHHQVPTRGRKQPRARLMVVEDDLEMAHALRFLLEQEQFDVTLCANGSEALVALREQELPDLIVLDLWTPQLNGWQFRLEQKREPAWSHIRVLALSADRSAHAAAIDADGFLAKPVSRGTLLAAVERLIEAPRLAPLPAPVLPTPERAGDLWNAVYMALGDLADARAHTKMLAAEVRGFPAARAMALDVLLERAESCTRRALTDCDGSLPAATGVAALEEPHTDVHFTNINAFLEAVDPKDHAHTGKASRTGMWPSEQIERQDADPVWLLARCMRSLAGSLPVSLAFEFVADGAPAVRADPALLAQLLRNLLRNAVEALASAREPALRIRVVSFSEFVELRIADSGHGMPVRELERAFDPFFSTKLDHNGLGLTVVRRLAARMDARVDLEREPGGGVAVRLLLPIARAGRLGAGAPRALRPSLLLLHQPDRARRMQLALAEHFNVVVMGPEDAIRHLLGGASYDMVMCSLVLPEMTGISFASSLAMTRPTQAERLVLLVPPHFGRETSKLLEQLHIWHVEEALEPERLSETLSGLLRLWSSLGFR